MAPKAVKLGPKKVMKATTASGNGGNGGKGDKGDKGGKGGKGDNGGKGCKGGKGGNDDMQIFVKTITGETITIDVRATDTINYVRAKVSRRCQLHPTDIHLFQEGVPAIYTMYGEYTLSRYNINNGDTLVVQELDKGKGEGIGNRCTGKGLKGKGEGKSNGKNNGNSGNPLAWLLAKGRSKGKSPLDMIVVWYDALAEQRAEAASASES